jgi:hypothetical protein
MNHSGKSSALNPLYLDVFTSSPGTQDTKTLEKSSARILARGSAAISAFLSGLIVVFVAANSGTYRDVVPLALTYALAYALAAYGAWQMSRIAAISALLLYVPMHHSNCGLLHMAVHLGICILFAGGIAGTMLIHQEQHVGVRST